MKHSGGRGVQRYPLTVTNFIRRPKVRRREGVTYISHVHCIFMCLFCNVNVFAKVQLIGTTLSKRPTLTQHVATGKLREKIKIQLIICWFTCFVQDMNLKLFCQFCRSEQKQFYVRYLYKTSRSTRNLLSNFGLIQETMDLSRILLSLRGNIS